MKQFVEELADLAIWDFHLITQESSYAFSYRADVTAGQFPLAYAINDFFAMPAVIEVVPEPRHPDLRQDDVFLVMIFVSLTGAEIGSPAFRTLVKPDIHVFVSMIGSLAGGPDMSNGCATLLGRVRRVVVFGRWDILFEKLLSELFDLELERIAVYAVR